MKLSPNALAAAIGISATSLAIYSGYAKLAATDAKIASLQSKIAALEGTKTSVNQANTARLLRADRILVPEDIDTFGLVDQGLSMNLLSSHDLSPPGLSTLEGEANGKAGKASPGGQTSSTSPTYVGKSGKGGKMSSGTKRAVCYSDNSTEIVTAETGFIGIFNGEGYEQTVFEGSFDFTTLSVGPYSQDILVDLTATTGTFRFSGAVDYDDPVYPSWESLSDAAVLMGVELIAPNNSTVFPVPQAMVTLTASADDVFFVQNDDPDLSAYAVFFAHDKTETHSAKFFFPNLAAGNYKLKVRVIVESASGLDILSDDFNHGVVTQVVLGPHVLVAEVIDSADGQCAAPVGQTTTTTDQGAAPVVPAAMTLNDVVP